MVTPSGTCRPRAVYTPRLTWAVRAYTASLGLVCTAAAGRHMAFYTPRHLASYMHHIRHLALYSPRHLAVHRPRHVLIPMYPPRHLALYPPRHLALYTSPCHLALYSPRRHLALSAATTSGGIGVSCGIRGHSILQ